MPVPSDAGCSTHSSIGDGTKSVGFDLPTRSLGSGDPGDGDHLLSLYYRYFYTAHPCVLPQFALRQYAASDGGAVEPLCTVLRFIGSLHNASVSSSPLKEKAEGELAAIRRSSRTVTGFDVQAVLLYSIAVYWCDETKKGLGMLDLAIQLALDLGMNRSDYAVQNGRHDPSLEESWRRTWWQIYITDAHIAGSTHTYPFRTTGIHMTVSLPCEEEEYESGNIPPASTLEEYDMREFADENTRGFSSFAELVGLTRSLDLALAPRKDLDIKNVTAVSANVDATVASWTSLLPPSKKTVFRPDGTLDEVLFKANAILHTWIVDLHRQLSTLAYSTIEAVSYCAPPAPPDSLRGCNTPECQLHTRRVLHAIEQFESLLTLPANIAGHTPFIICMVANVAIAHLSACRYVFQGQELQLNRERIRVTMGVLKTLGVYWPLGKRTYQEISVVAREILSLDRPSQSPPMIDEPVHRPTELIEDMPAFIPEFAVESNSDFCNLFDLDFHEAAMRDAWAQDIAVA
ncbi:putative C6 transcription factor [Aspergillus clavatus NRRL 1]|uniref:Fungal specific transcription factor domain protein n=1 Tax=Aspergillus clavatus (strain ATCC 1007 / CBS 513.65 / DSM 816 / NCTC 3887 / NRRL 1 / QM 1276 / 107) TaxID=344612 RepID=A1C5L8_ASPCL|nr:fungal specific transcription factor domain protein [Aspergillus clavatus NRRL 1]EAW14986.1 fungal specific transcription factor domain protein [Aspergillus clavatus NRRL 1]